eukprot:TRINITY_DN80181_c0_g1_i1.p1 TRINITY_DN80181_c0_g1~~TRINITY_DN80181_c0_g1_i1.p1  ORF type:complete len:294 (+),score=61.82 TRINITY_DN80181_c0_g1_i1:57-938(+)
MMGGGGAAGLQALQGLSPKIDKQQLFDDAAKYALKDDWTCARGPPEMNGSLPGLRYGASLEIRPQLIVLPCPCAGGRWAKPQVDISGVQGSNGLWAAWPSQHDIVAAQNIGKAASDSDTVTAESGAAATDSSSAATNFFGIVKNILKGQAKGLLGSDVDKPGSEPYAADYGCAKGISKDWKGKLLPGKRWWNMPRHGTVVVTTPCPCALGPWTGLQAESQDLKLSASADMAKSVPDWQKEAVGVRNMGAAAFATCLTAYSRGSCREEASGTVASSVCGVDARQARRIKAAQFL